jgi:hypothetical protein
VADWHVALAPVSDRTPQERRIRRRQRMGLAKATLGVSALVVIATLATVGAVHTIASIAQPADNTRLQRYITGRDRKVVTPKGGHFKAAFPDDPTASTEKVHVLFLTLPAQRVLLPVNKDTVEVVWFDIPASVRTTDPQSTIATLATFLAVDLEGTAQNGQKVSGAVPLAYQFTVPEPSSRRVGTYYVRVILSGHHVWVLRVQTSGSDGAKALAALANSFELTK